LQSSSKRDLLIGNSYLYTSQWYQLVALLLPPQGELLFALVVDQPHLHQHLAPLIVALVPLLASLPSHYQQLTH
jgi:hypothetical protein